MTMPGNQDKYPAGYGPEVDAQRAAWMKKNDELMAEGNQDPFPRDSAAQTAWHSKDMELRRTAKTGKPPTSPPKVNGATADKSDAELVNDSCDLPMDALFLRKTLAAINPAERETFLMKLLVSSRDGGLPASVIVVAQEEFYGAQILDLMRENGKLFEEIRSLKLAQNHSDKNIIDGLADRLFDFVKDLVQREAKERFAALQAKVALKSSRIKDEGDAIAQLNAKATLLDGRIRYLELTSPIWVSVNSGE